MAAAGVHVDRNSAETNLQEEHVASPEAPILQADPLQRRDGVEEDGGKTQDGSGWRWCVVRGRTASEL